jgi:GT2 family glycosyltransferase
LARAGGDVTVLLNPDTVPRPGALEALAILARERDALHVPRLLHPDGTVQDSAHARPGRPRGLWPWPAAPWRSSREREVGWAVAACLAARTETLRGLGPFDAAAFLFYEDLDLCLRAARRDVPTVLHPSVEVVHVGGHSTASVDRLRIEAERRREVVSARLGRRALLLDDAGQALEFAVRAPWRPRARAQLAALRAARRARG